jgi:ubiquinone/menaquinone biosynthesis C-methylase UbiE
MKSLNEGYANYVRDVREKKPDAFFTLFDGGKNFDEALKIAKVIFERLILPFAFKYLGDLLNDKRSLDIGYGSGFQVCRASEYFEHAKGLDVHREANFVLDTFRSKKVKCGNVSLMEAEAANIPEPNDYIDFIHSWVVFLHFPSIEYVTQTLKEIYRVLKPGGAAVLYYPRLVKTKKKETPAEYEADIELENKHETGFEANESLTEVFKKGITIARWKMTELVTSIGFEILEHTSSNDGGFVFGQHGIVLRKPALVEPVKKPRLIKRKKSIKKNLS